MSESHKKSPFAWACIFTGGEYEIRTHGGVNHTAFPRLHLKPLGQLSKAVTHIILMIFMKLSMIMWQAFFFCKYIC